jgi:nicotinate-nucleotide adenylyltransferase
VTGFVEIGAEIRSGAGIGLFGGSFDPIHHGHVRPVQDARRALGLERVIYLPTADPPHKPGRRRAPALRRFAMVELALLGEPGLYVSGRELTPGEPTYPIDSVEAFARELPDARIHLVIGSDSFAELATWRRWRELIELARLVVLVRPGSELDAIRDGLEPDLVRLADSGGVDFVADRPLPISSTDLRRLLRRGETPPDGWLPPSVLDYVRKYSLYR